jgi:hypothetical protein
MQTADSRDTALELFGRGAGEEYGHVALRQAEGAVILRGLGEGGRPLILERDDDDFIQGMLDDLGRGLAVVQRSRAVDRATLRLQSGAVNTLKLYHPAGRVMHLALFELVCNDGAYEPRLDPRKFVEGCVVIRRVTRAGVRRWGRDNTAAQGWFPIVNAEQDAAYPDPAGRPPALRTGDAALDRELAALYSSPIFEETSTPLFLAPPEVIEAVGRTVLYCVIPTSSSDVSAAPAPFATPEALRNHLPSYLRGIAQTQAIGLAGTDVSYLTIAEALSAPSGDNGLFLSFVAMLRQLVFEFGAFDAAPSAAAQRILTALAGIQLRFVRGERETYRAADAYLRDAAAVLVTRTSAGTIQMPSEWPAVAAQTAQAIQGAVAEIVNARIATLRPREGRFSNPRSRYILRGFARVQHDRDCPAEVISSLDSEQFCIAPWYEGKAPPVPIVLPEMNMDALKQLKPNVAFAVPPEMQALLDLNDALDLADGKGKSAGVQLTIQWICSFSLPVITLCAFIVLNIFLQLFNIIFQWMMWLKICIPVPIPSASEE